MCLSKVYKKKPVNEGFGYKAVLPARTRCHALYRGFTYEKDEEWSKADSVSELTAGDGTRYRSGFHIYPDIRETVGQLPYMCKINPVIIVKVQYADARTLGIEKTLGKSRKVVVAKRMKIVKRYTKEQWNRELMKKHGTS